MIRASALSSLLAALIRIIDASAVIQREPEPVVAQQPLPLITPSPSKWPPTETIKRRGIISDLEGDVSSVLGGLGSDIPSFVASGVPNFFQGFPSGSAVVSSLGLNDSQVSALPTQVLNIP